MAANLTVYLVTRFNIGQLQATNITNIFYGTLNFSPLLGAFISDAYLGRFRTLAYGSFASLLVCPCTTSVPLSVSFHRGKSWNNNWTTTNFSKSITYLQRPS